MPTSVTCPSVEVMRRRGFTLLELLVVLALMGLLAALAAPALSRTIASWQRREVLSVLSEQIRSLPVAARQSGRAFVFDGDRLGGEPSVLPIAEGWHLSAPSVWRVHANGVCESGTLLLEHEGAQYVFAIDSPFCTPHLRAADAP